MCCPTLELRGSVVVINPTSKEFESWDHIRRLRGYSPHCHIILRWNLLGLVIWTCTSPWRARRVVVINPTLKEFESWDHIIRLRGYSPHCHIVLRWNLLGLVMWTCTSPWRPRPRPVWHGIRAQVGCDWSGPTYGQLTCEGECWAHEQPTCEWMCCPTLELRGSVVVINPTSKEFESWDHIIRLRGYSPHCHIVLRWNLLGLVMWTCTSPWRALPRPVWHTQTKDVTWQRREVASIYMRQAMMFFFWRGDEVYFHVIVSIIDLFR